MTRLVTVGLLPLIAACARQPPPPPPDLAVERAVVYAALESVPFDSIAKAGGYVSFQLDAGVRRLAVAAPFEPEKHEPAFRLDTLGHPFRLPSTQLTWSSDLSVPIRGETLRVSLGLVGRISPATDGARVILVLAGARTYGIIGSISLERRGQGWRVSRVYFEEG